MDSSEVYAALFSVLNQKINDQENFPMITL